MSVDESSEPKTLKVGQKVEHDFSQEVGVVRLVVKHSLYEYLVDWDNGKSDWYKREVLVAV